IALAVVDDNRVLAAADQEHTILLIDCDTCHVPVCKALRQLLPSLDNLVVHLICHAVSPSLHMQIARLGWSAEPYLPCDLAAWSSDLYHDRNKMVTDDQKQYAHPVSDKRPCTPVSNGRSATKQRTHMWIAGSLDLKLRAPSH